MQKRQTTNGFLATSGATLALAAVLASTTAQAEVSFSIDAGLRQENNIGLAPRSGDEVDDLTTKVAAGVSWAIVQSAQSEVAIGAGVYYDRVDDISDISRKGFSVNAKYRGQASPELTSVFWILDGEYRTLDYKDSDIRDGYEVKFSATVGKRFNQKFTLQGGYRIEERTSDDSSPWLQPASWNPTSVFDLDKDGWFLRGEIDATPDTLVFAEYSRMSGDVAATGRGFNNGAAFDRAWDYAFGPGFIVWKLDADQDIFEIGVSHQFSERISAELAASYMDASGQAGNDYDNQVYTLNVGFAF